MQPSNSDTHRRKPPPGWKPGQSGNPAGRPRGVSEVGKIRAGIAARLPEILEKLIQLSMEGDTAAARLLLERAIAPLRSIDPAVTLNLDGDSLTDKGRAVLAAVAAGQLAPSIGTSLVSAIGALAKVVQIDELERRITALEAEHGND